MYKYFIHYNLSGEIVGYDMAPDHLTVEDFNKNNSSLQTIEVDKEAFEAAKESVYKKRMKVG